MVKPKGVWLQTTELVEIKEAQVVQGARVLGPKVPASSESRGKRPLLLCALGSCCGVLVLLVGLHVYPVLSAAPQEADPSLVEAAAQAEYSNIVSQSYQVMINADGHEYITVCSEQTVAQALHQVGVELGINDEVSLPLDAPIEADTIISVSRLYSRVETETEEISPVRSRVEDASLAAGASKMLEEGEPGLRENTISVSYRDGEEIERTVIASRVLKEPGITTVAYGAALASRGGSDGNTAMLSVNGEDLNYTHKLSVESTAYTWTGNTTATGTWPAKGTVAVDPRVIPLGSKLYVEGYGFATATDTGGAIKGNIIDVYFSTYEECIKWGRKHGITVYILE